MPGRLAVVFLVVAGAAVYLNSLHGVFIFDDIGAIRDNATIRQLWPLGPVLFQADYTTVVGRPLLNLSLALNYALHGLDVRGYHALNIILHILCGLALFGVIRRTLMLPSSQGRSEGHTPTLLAMAASVIWMVHPLQTESVTYIVQRAEILVGLFYLAAFYCVIRGARANPRLWYSLAALACAMGVFSKEVMATAPLLILVFDRVYLSRSFREALQHRRSLYLALFASWLLLAFLVLSSGGRQDTAGFGYGVTWWQYARTQPYYIVRYLWLSLWPDSLVLDYGQYIARSVLETLPHALIVLSLLAAVAAGFRRRPKIAFCGLWFFVLLAPTSTLVPIVTQTGAEHRMYLPLAGVVALVVIGAHWLWQRVAGGRYAMVPWILLAASIIALGWRTVQRNQDYRSEAAIWKANLEAYPRNIRAYYNLGLALADEARFPEAIAWCREALKLDSESAPAHLNMGLVLARSGIYDDAITHYRQALRLKPGLPEAHNNLGLALARTGKLEEAIGHYQRAIRLSPDYALAHNNLANALAAAGNLAKAVAHYGEALRLQPDLAQAHNNIGRALADLGRTEEALPHLDEALRLEPGQADIHNNLGLVLVQAGRLEEAAGHFREALRLNPNLPLAHRNLGNLLTATDRSEEAVRHYRLALEIKPDLADALNKLAWIYATEADARLRDGKEAVLLAQRACGLANGRNPLYLSTLAAAYAEAGSLREAVQTAEAALALARAAGMKELADAVEGQTRFYRSNRPFRAGSKPPQ